MLEHRHGELQDVRAIRVYAEGCFNLQEGVIYVDVSIYQRSHPRAWFGRPATKAVVLSRTCFRSSPLRNTPAVWHSKQDPPIRSTQSRLRGLPVAVGHSSLQRSAFRGTSISLLIEVPETGVSRHSSTAQHSFSVSTTLCRRSRGFRRRARKDLATDSATTRLFSAYLSDSEAGCKAHSAD